MRFSWRTAPSLGLAAGLLWIGSAVRADERPLSILLLTVDALRSDHLGAYGYARPTSPRIDELAAHSALFLDATAVTAWTGPGILSLFLGQHPAVYAIDSRYKALDPFLPTPLRELGRRGYQVRGFQAVVDPYRNVGLEGPDLMGESAEVTLERLAADPARRPFFLWHHVRSVHLPYVCQPELRAAFDRPDQPRLSPDQLSALTTRSVLPAGSVPWDRAARPHLVDLYDACVRQADEEVGSIVDKLRELRLWDSTLVVLTADHGEELLEHGEVGHASTVQATRLHGEVLRLPLLVRIPGQPGGRRISGFAQAIDVMPTLFDALGIRDWPWFQGESLLPAIGAAGTLDRQFAFAESTRCGWQCDGDRSRTVRERAVRSQRWHYLARLDEDSQQVDRKLYDRRADPEESADVAAQHPSVVAEMEAALDRRSAEDLALAERLVREALARRGASLQERGTRGSAWTPGDTAATCDELRMLRSVYRVANPSLLDGQDFAGWFERAVASLVERLGPTRYWGCRDLLAGAGPK